jgi:hypothetical protein
MGLRVAFQPVYGVGHDEVLVTDLRRIMLEELQRRNYADSTARYYVRAVEQFARHFDKPPDKLGLEHLRTYQAYLLKQRKLAVGTVVSQVAVLRFFFVRTPTMPGDDPRGSVRRASDLVQTPIATATSP